MSLRVKNRRRHRSAEVAFAEACLLLKPALTGTIRQDVVADTSSSTDFRTALLRLREGIGGHLLKAGSTRFCIEPIVKGYDRRSRLDGFHALHDWDGTADKVNPDIIPIDVINYLIDGRGAEPPDRTALAILLDYYFLYVLALLSLRVWDDGHPDENLDRLEELLGDLQGPNGSGQRFVENAETLLLIATSHYELDDSGYDRLLERVKALNQGHRRNIALVHAASLGCHLRFGFEATYGRDTRAMREDNATDYPWLCFALTTLMTEYAAVSDCGPHETLRDRIAEGILNGLSPDAGAFLGALPAALSRCGAERSAFQEWFHNHRVDVLVEFERLRPSEHTYSPLSLFFNFSQNVLKGIVIDALFWGEASGLMLNDLFTAASRGARDAASKETLARALMGYARANPERIRGRWIPAIVYDPPAGHRAFAAAMRELKR